MISAAVVTKNWPKALRDLLRGVNVDTGKIHFYMDYSTTSCFLFQILLDELSSTKYWVSMHVSDHSGFHYRQFLIKSLTGRTVADNTVLVQNQLVNQQSSSLPKDEENEAAEATCAEEQNVDLSQLLEEELELCTDLIDTYPGHETLWCHR